MSPWVFFGRKKSLAKKSKLQAGALHDRLREEFLKNPSQISRRMLLRKKLGKKSKLRAEALHDRLREESLKKST